jgi:hypothetical protein
MDVHQDPSERTTPLGTPFDDGYTTHPHEDASSADPPVGVHTRIFFTPLYTASQETSYTTATAGHQTQHPASGHLDTIYQAEAEELATAEASEAEALQNAELEAKAGVIAAATTAEEEAAKAAAEAVAVAASHAAANLAATTEAEASSEAAAAKSTYAEAAETKAAALAAVTQANITGTTAAPLNGTSASETAHPKNNTPMAQQTGVEPSARAAARAVGA